MAINIFIRSVGIIDCSPLLLLSVLDGTRYIILVFAVMSEANVDSIKDRNDIYSQIFGVERRPDSFVSFDDDLHGDIRFQVLPSRIEDIENLSVLISEDIANDIIIAKQKRHSASQPVTNDPIVTSSDMGGKNPTQTIFYRNKLLSRMSQIHKVYRVLIIPLSVARKKRGTLQPPLPLFMLNQCLISTQQVIMPADRPKTIVIILCLQCLQETKSTKKTKVLRSLYPRGNLHSRN